MRLGAWLDRERRLRGLRRRTMAEELEFKISSISQYSTDIQLPPLSKRIQIENYTKGAVKAESTRDWPLLKREALRGNNDNASNAASPD